MTKKRTVRTVPEHLFPRMAELYQSGMAYRKVAKEIGYPKERVREALVAYGIGIRKPKWEWYNIDEHAFDVINSEHAAYWLGFIYADGCVSGNSIRVDLNKKDESHLEKLKAFLRTKRPLLISDGVGFDKYTEKRLLVVGNKHLASQLKLFGIIKGRPDVSLMTTNLSPGMERHCIRGYLDGDGNVRKRYPAFRFVGAEDILKWIANTFAHDLNLKERLHFQATNSNKVQLLEFSGWHQCMKITQYLYEDATVWLERKRHRTELWKKPQILMKDEKGRFI